LGVALGQAADNGVVTLHADGTFTYTHNGGETLTDRFTYFVTDNNGSVSDEIEVSIAVVGVNDVPVLSQSVANQVATEGTPFALFVSPATYEDVDVGDTVTLSAQLENGQPLPSWLSFDAATNSFSGTPENADVGSYLIRIDAVDSQGAAAPSLTFAIEVENTNNAPELITLSGDTVSENVSGVMIGTLSATDIDTDDEVEYSVDDARFEVVEGALFLKSGAALDHETEPQIDLQVTAADTAGETTNRAFVLQVVDANDAPQLVSSPTPVSLSADAGFVLPADTFVDADTDELSYTVTLANGEALPSWLSFDSTTRELIFLQDIEAQEITVAIVVDDGRGGTASVDMILQLEPRIAPAIPQPVAVVPTQITSVVSVPEAEDSDTLPDAVDAEVDEILDADQHSVEGLASVHNSNTQSVNLASMLSPMFADDSNSADDGASTEHKPEVRDIESIKVAKLVVSSGDVLSLQDIYSQRALFNLMNEHADRQVELQEDEDFAKAVLGTSISVTSGLTVSYLIWLIRGGTLLGSALSSLPAWRLVDPLPVLASLTDDNIDGEDDGESLQTLVNSQTESDADATDASHEQPES